MQQQLAEARAALERHMIKAEAACKSLEANALKQKTEELMQQKETLDRCAEACCGLRMAYSAESDPSNTSRLSRQPATFQEWASLTF